ncbi:hypothetical protein BV898_06491 [Hypsibius exemplaris]|uniref:SLC26A/SulP transporter domain-containing protein n=1 Tax=Hypsibius exemplaris TaxID=2072580 RepID=A0A1W0WWD4_HYPEX|nr:hypothetical protein BV898_06491 [Hypsibius exemplaris]
MSIPSGMAYSLLASMPAIYGLYTSFFPSLTYSIMASSKHVSIGVFAIVSIMAGKVVQQYALPNHAVSVLTAANISIASSTSDVESDVTSHLESRIEVMICVTLAVGICRFTTGTAVHVFTSQLKSIFGLRRMRDFNGPLKIIYTWIEFFSAIPYTHFPSLIISVVCLNFLLMVKYGFKREQMDTEPLSLSHSLAWGASNRLMLIVLLFLGNLLEALPKACLGCIIAVALIGMLKDIWLVRKLGKISAIDASVFLISLLAVVILDVDIGLAVPSVAEVDGCKIIGFNAPLYFANADYFLRKVRAIIHLSQHHAPDKQQNPAPKRVNNHHSPTIPSINDQSHVPHHPILTLPKFHLPHLPHHTNSREPSMKLSLLPL